MVSVSVFEFAVWERLSGERLRNVRDRETFAKRVQVRHAVGDDVDVVCPAPDRIGSRRIAVGFNARERSCSRKRSKSS